VTVPDVAKDVEHAWTLLTAVATVPVVESEPMPLPANNGAAVTVPVVVSDPVTLWVAAAAVVIAPVTASEASTPLTRLAAAVTVAVVPSVAVGAWLSTVVAVVAAVVDRLASADQVAAVGRSGGCLRIGTGNERPNLATARPPGH